MLLTYMYDRIENWIESKRQKSNPGKYSGKISGKFHLDLNEMIVIVIEMNFASKLHILNLHLHMIPNVCGV